MSTEAVEQLNTNAARVKKQVNIDRDLMLKAEHIADTFNRFTEGVRLMLLIHRAKEGSVSPNNDHVKKLTSSNPKEFIRNLYDLLVIQSKSEDTLRIYSCVNSRSMWKAVREFKKQQLEADYYDPDSHDSFYFDIRNRFMSALMKPSSAQESYFIIDVDDKSEVEDVLRNLPKEATIVQQYATKNGWHIVTEPFNPALLGKYAEYIHKDALLLLAF